MVVWKAQHDNGWSTAVIERPDHTFAAAAGPGNALDLATDFHETVNEACAAAKSALQRRTGHACSARCSEWALTLTRDVDAEPPEPGEADAHQDTQ